ncbi:MAG TPA: class I SAM-dependent methyltransferase [Jatrophihabitans sp.]|jgi:SAM-dependent methyltransferase
MGWEQAGVAWNARALDWAYLMELQFVPVYAALGDHLDVGPGATLLDVGCGSGGGLRHLSTRGCSVAGIDAAAGLLDIARARLPGADLRLGTMTELPWQDATFSHIIGVNAFIYADDGALADACRVIRPGGLLGIGFWQDPRDFGWALAALGAALAPYVGDDDAHTPLRMADPEVAAGLLGQAGFEVVASGSVLGTSEFADVDQAYRALASTGMIYPLIEHDAEAELKTQTLAALATLFDPSHGIRMSAQFGWLVARRR